MANQSRREFISALAGSVLAYSLLDLLTVQKAFASKISSKTSLWLKNANDVAISVKRREITALAWQQEMEKLLTQIDIQDFLKYIDFDTLQRQANLPNKGESFKFFTLPQDSTLPHELTFYRNLAGFRKDRAIPPHGHDNLVSSFMVLNGSLHGRHFDRIHDEGDSVFIKPTIDKVFTTGQFSTVSESKDNVHWFKAINDGSFIFDLGVAHLDPHWTAKGLTPEQAHRWKNDSSTGGPAKTDRVYLDIDRKEKADEEMFRVSRLTNEQAYLKYG